MVRFNCPGCRVVLKAPNRHIGAAMPCPKCGHRLYVPGPLPTGAPAPTRPPLSRPLLIAGGAGALALAVGLLVALILIFRPSHRGGDAVAAQTPAASSPAPPDGEPRPPSPAAADQPTTDGTRSVGGRQPLTDMARRPVPPDTAEEPEEGRRYALVVGVQDYKGTALGSLRYCDNDAAGLAEVLGQRGYRVTLMTRPEYKARDRDDLLPTADNIRDNLQAVLRNLKPVDTVLLAFAGHGEQLKKDGKMYFLPAKCDLEKPETLIALDEVYALLSDNPARGKVLIVDACRNDPLAGRAVGSENLESVTRPPLPEPPGGTVALFSCSKDQVAYESDALRHGFLFHFVIEGLEGKAANKKDGRITWLGLAKHVDDELPEAVVGEHGPKAVQTPEARGEVRGLVLARLDAGAGSEEKPGEEITNSIGMKLRIIKPGKFLMGSPENEEGRNKIDGWEGPQHEVEITKPFFMGAYPVTKGQFAQFVREKGYRTEAETDKQGGFGYNAATHKIEGRDPKYNWNNTGWEQRDDSPVVNVSWNDAQAFCAWLSQKENKHCHYALPTEAEWEYACRAGTKTRFWCGDTDDSCKNNANVADPSLKGALDGLRFTSPVGSFKPNGWGLYDMAGNVLQWSADGWYTAYQAGPLKDPIGIESGTNRAVRGGSWAFGPGSCRSASRNGYVPAGYSNVGFRVVNRDDLLIHLPAGEKKPIY